MINKKLLLCVSLAHLAVLGMEQDISQSPLETYLKEHKWHERKDALSQDQREEFADYLEGKKATFKTPISDNDLGPLLVTGLSEVERKKSPEELQEMLHKGIIEDSAKKVAHAVRTGADINVSSRGKPPIVWAVLLNRIGAVEELLKHDINVDVSYRGMPLVSHATWAIGTHHNNSPSLRSALLLLKKGALVPNVQTRDHIMITAIHGSDMDLIKEMIARGFDFGNMSHLVWASALKNRDILKFFIANGANPNQEFVQNPARPLNIAIEIGDVEVVKILLDAGADINHDNNSSQAHAIRTPLDDAIRHCRDDKRDIIQLLAERGAFIS